MKAPVGTPCKECPMRRVSLPGYLGADEPKHFIEQIHGDFAMPCHSTVDYEDPDWRATLDDARQCSGQAIYLTNVCKKPRPGPIAAETLPENTDLVFATRAEFLDHHTKGPMAKKTTKKTAAKKPTKKAAKTKPTESELCDQQSRRSEAKARAVADELLAKIDRAGAPERMSKIEWKYLLDDLIFDLGTRLECVDEELDEDGRDLMGAP